MDAKQNKDAQSIEDTPTIQPESPGQTDEPKVTIEIMRHRQVFDLLNRPRTLWKLIAVIIVLVVLIFFALAGITLILKRYYPYNDIDTNLYGATTMKNEDKEITYWLFNTAELWANSGIHVEENDILTIRASGAWHTAIHHLVKEAEDNSMLRDPWITVEGANDKLPNDEFRAQFRLSPSDIDGIVLMGIFPDKIQKRPNVPGFKATEFLDAIDSESCDIYRIGRERVDMRVLSKGVLHFTVNDIVLTRKRIIEMYKAFINRLRHEDMLDQTDAAILEKWVNGWRDTDRIGEIPEAIRRIDSKFENHHGRFRLAADTTRSTNLYFGSYPGRSPRGVFLDNELIYYFDKSYYNAWFEDNLGSALIIIERKHS